MKAVSRSHSSQRFPSRHSIVTFIAFALLLLQAVQGYAATTDYPVRPLRLIVPFAAGGTSDILGRIVSARMQETLGQRLVVDNRGGAGGMIGTDLAAKAVPDGYTLVLG